MSTRNLSLPPGKLKNKAKEIQKRLRPQSSRNGSLLPDEGKKGYG